MTAPLSRMESKKRQNLKNRVEKAAHWKKYYQEHRDEIRAKRNIYGLSRVKKPIGEMIGTKIPVKPLRRQVFVTAPYHLTDQPIPLTIDFHRGWYFRPEVDGFLLSGPLDLEPSFNTNIDYEAMAEASENAIYRVPALEKARIARGWAGLYEISPDNHAILGKVPEVEGFILANGFSGHGFQHSPAVGKVIAELIVEGKSKTIDISPLSIERFEKGELILEPMTAFKE